MSPRVVAKIVPRDPPRTSTITVPRAAVVTALKQQLAENLAERRQLRTELQRLRARRSKLLRDGIAGDADRSIYAAQCHTLAVQERGLKGITRTLTFMLGALKGRTKTSMTHPQHPLASKKPGVTGHGWGPRWSNDRLGHYQIRLPTEDGLVPVADLGDHFWHPTEPRKSGDHQVRYMVVYQQEEIFLNPELSVCLNEAFQQWMRSHYPSLSTAAGADLHQSRFRGSRD